MMQRTCTHSNRRNAQQLHGMLGHIDAVDRHNMRLRKEEYGERSERIEFKGDFVSQILIFKEFMQLASQ